jgi:hypothetical protein
MKAMDARKLDHISNNFIERWSVVCGLFKNLPIAFALTIIVKPKNMQPNV